MRYIDGIEQFLHAREVFPNPKRVEFGPFQTAIEKFSFRRQDILYVVFDVRRMGKKGTQLAIDVQHHLTYEGIVDGDCNDTVDVFEAHRVLSLSLSLSLDYSKST